MMTSAERDAKTAAFKAECAARVAAMEAKMTPAERAASDSADRRMDQRKAAKAAAAPVAAVWTPVARLVRAPIADSYMAECQDEGGWSAAETARQMRRGY